MIPENIVKVDRDQFLTFLDTTPTGNNPTWAVLGVGVTDYGISYNPQVDTEKWIIEKNARTIHSSSGNLFESRETHSLFLMNLSSHFRHSFPV
jgi:hypothetical protein